MSSIFEQVRSTVTARQAAERYGMTVTSNGLTCCPFHNDHTPSMKIAERFYCFACGAKGDAINLTQQLFGCGAYPAACRLAEDFGIPVGQPAPQVSPVKKNPPDTRTVIRQATDIVLRYLRLLERWRTDFAPAPEDEKWDPRFEESLSEMAFTEYLLDGLQAPSYEEAMEYYETYKEKIMTYKAKLEQEERKVKNNAGNAAQSGGNPDPSDLQ